MAAFASNNLPSQFGSPKAPSRKSAGPSAVGISLPISQSLMPNLLVELTRYGMAPGPRGAYVHLPPRGPGATPPLSAHRER